MIWTLVERKNNDDIVKKEDEITLPAWCKSENKEKDLFSTY